MVHGYKQEKYRTSVSMLHAASHCLKQVLLDDAGGLKNAQYTNLNELLRTLQATAVHCLLRDRCPAP